MRIIPQIKMEKLSIKQLRELIHANIKAYNKHYKIDPLKSWYCLLCNVHPQERGHFTKLLFNKNKLTEEEYYDLIESSYESKR